MADAQEVVDSSDTCPGASSTAPEPVDSANSTTPADVGELKTDRDLVVEAVQYLQQGKRHMIVSDYRSAVTSFEQACQLLDSCYGPGSTECGEAYLQYGIALFELARLEEGTDGGVVNVENQISSEDEGENEGENDEEEEEQPDGDDENEAEAKASVEDGVVEEKIEVDLTQPSTSKGESSAVSASNGDKSDEEEDADAATNTEVAWEVLGLARDIFSNGELTKESRLNLAEALQRLGEISIEWENNENAIHLLNECLEHRKEVLEPDDRLIALTYHYLGIAFTFKNEADRANSCLESALDVIQLKIKHLRETNTDNMDQIDKDSHEREINQLVALIPELNGKLEDLKEQMQSQYKTLETLQKESEKEDEIKQAKVAQNKPINNISHLIKRKKEEVIEENGSEVNIKKARTADVNTSVAADSSEAN